MNRFYFNILKTVFGVVCLLLTGCATPFGDTFSNIFSEKKKNDLSPEDTIIKRDAFVADRNVVSDRVFTTPLRPEIKKEEEKIIENKKVEEKFSGAEYIVKKGDCLCWISRKFNITLSDLLKANNLERNAKLFVGRKLILPGVSQDRVDRCMEEQIEYIIRDGDCLSKIAQEYDISVRDLQMANGLKDDKIIARKTLMIPTKDRYSALKGNPRGVQHDEVHKFEVDQNGYYTLQDGDSLSKIAEDAKVTVRELQEWNDITDVERIRYGQKILVKKNDLQSVNIPTADSHNPAVNIPEIVEVEEAKPVLIPRQYDFVNDVDFFGAIDDIPVLQVQD